LEYIYTGLRRSVHEAEPLRTTLVRELGLADIDRVMVERESIDARQKPDVVYVYSLRFTVAKPSPRLQQLLARKIIAPYQPERPPEPTPRIELPPRPVIVGFGPAGMFAGLWLARLGYRPIIFERGRTVEERMCDVARLWDQGILDAESNMQFGEGGAGTFSDGKLSTGKSSPLDRLVLETFAAAGAPESILCQHKPHIGTDNLRNVVVNLRKQIESLGGEVCFQRKLTHLHLRDGAVEAITVSGERVATSCVILAMGHSARDTVKMLYHLGVAMEVKPFAVGVRIEHPAEFINEVQYGAEAAKVLPAADYKLTYQYGGVGVYSFCVCPGGQVVCASSEAEELVTNGMSRYARDTAWSNGAIVVGVNPATLGCRSPLDAIAYQRALERRAFDWGGGGYIAPAQRAADFCAERDSRSLPAVTYRPGVVASRLHELLPAEIVTPLQAALQRFDRLMPGFLAQGVLIAPETRTSSPVRILRDENYRSVSTEGLYLLGEGAGYAGGIMTCARDAVKFARLVRAV